MYDDLINPESHDDLKERKSSLFVTLGKIVAIILICGLLFFLCLYTWANTKNKPSNYFPLNQPITISPGTGVKGITKILAEQEVVQSETLLYYILVSFYDPTQIKASTYVFDKPLTTIEVAERLTQGDFDTDLIRFTHYEGERATQIAKRASDLLPNFNPEEFIVNAEPEEGRLFPETYLVPQSYDDRELLTLMLDTFEEKTEPLSEKISSSTLTKEEIIILASVIEREANSPESKKMVSGILQNRMTIGMPLQADASIEYILNKPLAELTPADLEIDTPYNTYLYKGLPPTPIGNPGLDSILAVLEPTESDYLFYITGYDGEFHYAKTYQQHLVNIERYLRQ
ncbi:endolytic transglycosylase MltG [Candidatus Nomurabacteria bacterium]|nr:endolytic transglycosylase MltG [Candidatus Nomurabacteria bacterium]